MPAKKPIKRTRSSRPSSPKRTARSIKEQPKRTPLDKWVQEHDEESPGTYRGSERHGGGYTNYDRRSRGGGFIGGDGMRGSRDYDYDREG